MAKIGKIEKHNLGPRILKLLTEEGKNSQQIAETLTNEGFKLSQPTVSRWIKEQRDSHKDEVIDIVSEHVSKVIPNDLKALERMGGLVLNWAEEEPDTKAERISTWEKIYKAVIEFRDLLLPDDEKERIKIVRLFIKQCFRWILEDINIQKERIAAMRMATTIIDTKLKYSVILVDTKEGNIYIEKAKGEDTPPDSEKRQLYLVKKEDDVK